MPEQFRNRDDIPTVRKWLRGDADLAVQGFARSALAALRAGLAAPGPLGCGVRGVPRRQSACVMSRDALMRSTTGRPRRTTDEQVRIILEWHAEYRAWIDKRPAIPSLRSLARQLGMSRSVVCDVVRTQGQFKQASPEDREAELSERSRLMQAIHARQRR